MISPAKDILVVMAKAPVSGQVKTRLCPPLSPGQAAAIYDCFLKDRLREMSDLAGCDRAIAYMPQTAMSRFETYANGSFDIFPQRGNDLGNRMHNIFVDRFREGFVGVVIIGSDSPDLPKSIITESFQRLSCGKTEVVIGPATDGGYYLVGMKRIYPELFADVPWSTDKVLTTTLEIARSLGLRTDLLPEWSDIDTYHNLL
ncbi:MAG: TIGR04282 family arsenosugar biosynthesis glycosyltransferase, partial [Desulfobacterales bacterium]